MTTQEIERLLPRFDRIGKWLEEVKRVMPTGAEGVDLAYALTGLTLDCNGLIDELRSICDV